MPRSIWSGTISFGLVSIPVKLFSAIQQKDLRFHQLEEATGARIRYKRVSEKTGREVPYEKIVKGFETDKTHMVVVKPEELEEFAPEATKSIDIEDFVALQDIDPIYYEHAYYLAPDRGGAHAYSLLLRAMEDGDKVGIGRVVIRTKQYLAAVRAKDGALMLETMLFHDEVVPKSKIDAIPDRPARIPEKELAMAKQLMSSLSTEFKPEKYKDEHRERVLDFIKKKAKGATIEAAPEERETPKVADLMEALRASLEGGAKAKGASRAKRASARRAPAHARSSRTSRGKTKARKSA